MYIHALMCMYMHTIVSVYIYIGKYDVYVYIMMCSLTMMSMEGAGPWLSDSVMGTENFYWTMSYYLATVIRANGSACWSI